MSAALPIPVIQLLQVLTVALGAPGVTGVIARVEARLQGRRGPRVLQPYYDLAKLFRKEALAPEQASWFFLAAPLIAVTCYLTIPLLIPVLTSYGLPLGYMGDILGGGFLLSLASFVVATAALETGSPPPAQVLAEADKLRMAVMADADALMGTSSFLDRLRGTGPLTPARARQHGALGPIGKASGYADDARLARPYDGYWSLAVAQAPVHDAGDALARLRVRWEEVDQVGGGGSGVRPDPAGRRESGRTGWRSRPRHVRARPRPGHWLGRSPARRGSLRSDA